MITIKHLSIFMILIGAAFLSLSFAPARKIWEKVSGLLRRKWLIILYLMAFFLLGYLFFDIVLISDLPFPVELVTAGVFLGGAVFVYLIINISQSTIAERQRAEEEIRVLNESLEIRVADRTEALRLSNEFNNTVMNSIADSIAVIDVKTYEIIDVNQAFLRETRLPREQVLGKACFEVTHHRTDPCTPPHDACPLQETLSRGVHAVNDHVHWTSDGEKRFVEVLTSPLWNEQGEIGRVVHIQRDITERKRLEERLNRAEKMEVLGNLAGGVAHDLNNILGVVVGYSELLALKIAPDDPARIYADKILKSSEKGAAIIQDLLTLSRRGVVVSDDINLNTIITTFLQSPVFGNFEENHPRVTFRTELDDGLLNIKGSPVHLEKTVMNLISNAAEAITGKGEVTIRTENRHLEKPIHGYDDVKKGEYAALIITDNGGGIPASDVEKIFEPFYTKKVMGRSGTGLGLAVVGWTVQDHHGYIDVQSELGHGTAITLYFPISREKTAADQPEIPADEYLGHGESILVVDDVADQREMAAAMLTDLGYRVEKASSGEEAIEYVRKHKIDLVILDMIMEPGIDGLETYRGISKIHPDQKAVIVSGFSETDRVKKAIELGAGAYVKKPYLQKQIGMTVQNVLRR